MNCWLDEKYEGAEEKRSLLQVKSEVEESKGEELIKKGEVDVNVELSFWVMGSSGQLAELERVAGEEVLADVQYWKEGGLKLRLSDLALERAKEFNGKELYCKPTSGEVKWVGESNDVSIGNVMLKSDGSGMFKGTLGRWGWTRVSVVKCESENNGKNATCDLKLSDNTGRKC